MAQKRTQKLAFAALFAALTFAATWVSFPSPFGGNVNLGDCILLITAWLPLEPWSIFACAIGASMTDLAAGYAIYAPATFVIKALMDYVRKHNFSVFGWYRIVLGILVLGYFVVKTII